VADAALLLGAMAGPDAADPATAGAAGLPADYTGYLDPGALAGSRLGLWRQGSESASPATVAQLDAAIALLRASGAEVVDPVELADAGKIFEPEYVALRHEFKHDLNAYLAALPGEHPMTLAELITFNIQNADRTFAYFGQDMFERAEATSGDLGDPAYLAARDEANRLAHTALDGALDGDRLDAVVALSGGPSRLIDHLLGDTFEFHTSGPSAVCGYPSLSVPAGQVAGLPVGLTFMGRPWTEPMLLSLAYSFEVGGDLS
jgi:amidase